MLWQSTVGQSEGSFHLDVSSNPIASTYQLCVSNGLASPSGVWPDEMGKRPSSPGLSRAVKVGLNIRGATAELSSESDPSNPPQPPPPTTTTTEDAGSDAKAAAASASAAARAAAADEKSSVKLLEGETVELLEALQTLQDHMSYMRTREADHRDLVERTNERVWLWTLGEGALLIGVSGWQVWRLRSFFETKRKF